MPFELTFTGKVPVPTAQTTALRVLVTGASRGIGFGLVQQYATAFPGNIVFAGVRNTATVSEQLKSLAVNNHNVHIIDLDVDSEQSVRKSVSAVTAVTDHLDLLINNAGVIGDKADMDPRKVEVDHFLSVFQTNVVGVLLTTQAYLPLLERSASPKVANISTIVASNEYANAFGMTTAAYGTSKAALNYLTTTFRYAAPTVVFLSIHPGWVATDMGSSMGSPPIKTDESVQAIRYYIGEKTLLNTGEFFDAISGNVLPF